MRKPNHSIAIRYQSMKNSLASIIPKLVVIIGKHHHSLHGTTAEQKAKNQSDRKKDKKK